MKPLKYSSQSGFTIVEMMIAIIIFPIVVVGLSRGFESVNQSYKVAKQYNEMYAVLSACPEIDRALEYNSLTSSSNCYPNNVFETEGGGNGNITYNPTVSVTDTPSLPVNDGLQTVPDSKVVDITVPFLSGGAPDLRMRMLITRNGIGQI